MEEGQHYLQEAIKIDKNNSLAHLELGYIHSLKFGEESKANDCFDEVDDISVRVIGGISLLQREPEFKISLRDLEKQSESDLVSMKLAAAITYGYHNMVRQAVDWLNEISDNRLAKILYLHFKMNSKKERSQKNAELLQELISPYEQKTNESLDYYERSMLALCTLRLGQCAEEGVMDNRKNCDAFEYYQKSQTYDSDHRLLFEKLLPSNTKLLSRQDLMIFLVNGCKKLKNPIFEFELAKFFKDEDKNKELEHLEKAAKLGHIEANYLCGLNQIEKLKKKEESLNSKKAAEYFETAANKNHGPSYFELAKIKIEAGYYRDGIEDMKEADFLGTAEASYQLGDYHLTGFFGTIGDHMIFKIPPRPTDSMDYFQKAAILNYPKAMVKLGYFFEQGIVVPRDLKRAYNMYMRAIERGCPDGIGEYALGCWFEALVDYEKEGEIFKIPHKKNRQEAFNFFNKSMEKGNEDAEFKVGYYLLTGMVSNAITSQDQGLKILINQSSKGITKAMVELARFYESRNQVENAKKYWIKADTCLDPEAIEYLEIAYREGRLGFDIDKDKAAEYKEKAIIARKLFIDFILLSTFINYFYFF
jgi:TPR repeat protein